MRSVISAIPSTAHFQRNCECAELTTLSKRAFKEGTMEGSAVLVRLGMHAMRSSLAFINLNTFFFLDRDRV